MEVERSLLAPTNQPILKDIRDVRIDPAQSRGERLRSFLEQIGDPYHYRDGDIEVSVSYADTSCSLEDRLRSYMNTMTG